MRKLMLALFLAGATLLLTGSALDLGLAQKPANVPAAAKQELMKAAKAHGVKIREDKIEYATNQKMTIVRAPIEGSDKPKDADFEKGAPMDLAIIKSSDKFVVPDGSYVVKIQYPPNALSGKAIFTDAKGTVIGEQGLNQPLFPVWLSIHGDPCSIARFPRIVIVHPGPLSGPGGPYGITFPCADCACLHYNSPQGSKEDPTREIHAREAAFNLGDRCLVEMDFVCPRPGR